MAKFCGKCGAEMEDQALVCPVCNEAVEAAPAEPAAPEAAEAKATKKIDVNGIVDKIQGFTVKTADFVKDYIGKAKQNPKMWIAPGGILAALIAVIVILAIVIGNSGYKSALNNYCKLMMGNIKYMEKMAPKEYWDYLEEEEDVDLDEIKEELEDSFDDMKDELEDEYGKNVKMTYEVRDEDKLSKKEIKKIQEALEDQYDMDVKVKKGYELRVKFTIKGSEDDDSEKTDLTVVQIGSKWYVINCYEYDDEVRVSFIMPN